MITSEVRYLYPIAYQTVTIKPSKIEQEGSLLKTKDKILLTGLKRARLTGTQLPDGGIINFKMWHQSEIHN